VCKTQVKKGGRRSIEWIVRRLDPFDELACATQPAVISRKGSEEACPASATGLEPETQLERDLRASIESVAANGNGGGQKTPPPTPQPAPPTKLEHALKTAISAAYNAERYGAELGYVVRFDADAIKSMAITVLINMSGENRR
jgi:hypothetical protein